MLNKHHKQAKRIAKGHYQYKNYYAYKRSGYGWKITDLNCNLLKDYCHSLMACVEIIDKYLDKN